MPWTQAGIVYSSSSKVRVKKSKNAVNVYTFSDIRIARYVCSNQRLEDFLQRNMLVCPECGTINIFDRDNTYGIEQWQCKNCMMELLNLSLEQEDNVTHKRVRKNTEIKGQLSLFDL